MTGSLERAIKETDRRRTIQLAYNKKHGITPKTIMKEIKDIREVLGVQGEINIKEILKLELTAEPHELKKVIQEKEFDMRKAAQDLDFETAAILRDEIVLLKKEMKEKIPKKKVSKKKK